MRKAYGVILITLLILTVTAIAIPVNGEDSGAVSGFVRGQDNKGINGATVKLVDASDTSQVYNTYTTRDSFGGYQFIPVPVSRSYKIYASVNIDGQKYETYSDSFTVDVGATRMVDVILPVSLSATPTPAPTGGISGKITSPNNQGIPGAVIKVVDSDDLSHVYYTGTSNQEGYYQFTQVAITGGQIRYYKVYASGYVDSKTCEGYSASFIVEPGSTAAVNMVLTPPVSPGPTVTPAPTPVPTVTPAPHQGGISGRVTLNGTTGMGNATVMVVDASNLSKTYYITNANQDGYFQIAGVSITWDPALGTYANKYKAYASAYAGNRKYEGYSNSFAVEPGSTASVNVQVYPAILNNTTSGNLPNNQLNGSAGLQNNSEVTLAPEIPGNHSTPAPENELSTPVPDNGAPAQNQSSAGGSDILAPIKTIVNNIINGIIHLFG